MGTNEPDVSDGRLLDKNNNSSQVYRGVLGAWSAKKNEGQSTFWGGDQGEKRSVSHGGEVE